MEDDLIFKKKEDDLNFLKMEDDLRKIVKPKKQLKVRTMIVAPLRVTLFILIILQR